MHLSLIILLVSFAAVVAADESVTNETAEISPRIADGIESPYKINYYEVAIVSDSSSLPVVLCSGVIIKTEWILTSAYCIKKKQIWRVILGSASLPPVSLGETGMLVDDVIAHPNFNSYYMIHDIALLHVKHASTVTSITLAQLPPLPVSATEYNGQFARVLGYGYDGSEGTASFYILRYKDVYITDITKCTQSGNYMNYYKICTGGRSICLGDEGGPLIIGNTVIGIASSSVNSYNCAIQNSAVFTRVNYYRQWIDQTIASHKC